MSASPVVVTRVDLPGVPVFRRGKVRDVFDLGPRLLLVATDRLSAFDCVFPQGVPGKGRVLTALSRFWFEQLSAIVPNHLLGTGLELLPEELAVHAAVLEGRSMICARTEAFPVECVVRGYLAGSGWKEYQEKGTVSGVPLPPRLRLADRLPRPIFTPSTKAETGHDENITHEALAAIVGGDRARELERVSLALYVQAARHALARGVLIADTKFEFGLHPDGRLLLIDEALTPDSSRFWPASQYAPGSSPPSLDKQFVRDYLEKTDWDKRPPAPPLPDEVIAGTAARYREILEILTRLEAPRNAER